MAKLDWFMAGLFSGVLIIFGIALYHEDEASWNRCAEQGWFEHQNQKFECRPTGEWVDSE